MRILAIDTTGKLINIVLSCNGKIFSIERNLQLNDYESIISLMQLILKKAKLEIEQIDCLGVCIGPGSFTGIRIGLSAMKALAYSTNKPVVGFRSLDLAAQMVKDKFSGLLCIIQDAKRNNIYSAVYGNHRGLHRVSPYFLVGISQLLKEIKKLNKNNLDLYFYGDVVFYYKDDIMKFFPHSIILHHQDTSLKGAAMISLTQNNIKRKSNSFKILPFYMYPKDCQVRKSIK